MPEREHLLWFGVRTEFHENDHSLSVFVMFSNALGTETLKHVDTFWSSGL
jgi:hypothetical protein